MLRREAGVCRKESERAAHRICLNGWYSAVSGQGPGVQDLTVREQDGPVADVETLLARCAYVSPTEADALVVLAEVVTAVAAWR